MNSVNVVLKNFGRKVGEYTGFIGRAPQHGPADIARTLPVEITETDGIRHATLSYGGTTVTVLHDAMLGTRLAVRRNEGNDLARVSVVSYHGGSLSSSAHGEKRGQLVSVATDPAETRKLQSLAQIVKPVLTGPMGNRSTRPVTNAAMEAMARQAFRLTH